ncbi:hypothetical protein [Streptomyces mirabilis]|uniref:hypothetical protein n=1 Tax=Streptomyces mirabilis TaxID=68239 RepID=UPI00366039C9
MGAVPLNEAAGSLAKLGLHFVRGTVPRTELPRLVTLSATGPLADYRRSRAAFPRCRPGIR